MDSNKHLCLICGGPTIAGTTVCPKCQQTAENRRALYQPRGELRPYWDNASHDGPPAGFRIVGGPYDGTIVKAVTG
jgi:hypothetical protein